MTTARQLMMMMMTMMGHESQRPGGCVTYVAGTLLPWPRLPSACGLPTAVNNPGDSWCYNMTADVPGTDHKLNSETDAVYASNVRYSSRTLARRKM